MKEKIYTIPLNDALNEKCECVLCSLEEKMEKEAVEYFLGPSLMEPDGRMLTNEKGFCRRHMNMLLKSGNRLGLALMLETHIEHIQKKFIQDKKKGFLSKGTCTESESEKIMSLFKSCALCDKLNSQMRFAAQNLVFLIEGDMDFYEKFDKTGGLCLYHTALAIGEAKKEISGQKLTKFIEYIYEKQRKQLLNLQENLHDFTLSFDYRYRGKELSKDTVESVDKSAKKLTKF